MIGKGGYSEVYKGYLLDGQVVAVKRLAKDNADEAKEKVFLNELGVIGHVNHPNTSHLIGCCVENGLHLVFNFSSKGSLASALHGQFPNTPLDPLQSVLVVISAVDESVLPMGTLQVKMVNFYHGQSDTR